MRHLRCVVARWLRRQADRLDPPQEPTFRLTADATDSHGMTEAAEMLRRAKL